MSFILLIISILWRRQTHNFTCILGSGDFYGANDMINDDACARTFDDDLVAIYLGYYNV
jgi:hypothetical protein